jgi:excisionase family DNA binding protein
MTRVRVPVDPPVVLGGNAENRRIFGAPAPHLAGVRGWASRPLYARPMVPESAPFLIWDSFTISAGEDVTEEEARAIARFLNSPSGQEYIHRAAESLVRLRRATKRRKTWTTSRAPVVDPSILPFVLTVAEAAELLRTSVDAIYAQVERRQLTGAEGLIRDGRKVRFYRDKLLRSLERACDGRASRGGRR